MGTTKASKHTFLTGGYLKSLEVVNAGLVTNGQISCSCFCYFFDDNILLVPKPTNVSKDRGTKLGGFSTW